MTWSAGLRRGSPRYPRDVFERQNQELKELWERGWHTEAIAAYLGISKAAVAQRRFTLALPKRGGQFSSRHLDTRRIG